MFYYATNQLQDNHMANPGSGRPDLLTKERHDEAVKCFEHGDTQGMTAYIIGVGKGTLEGWLQRGRKELNEGLDTKYSQFCRDCQKAIAFKARERLQEIDHDATWQSKAWILERTFSGEFGKTSNERDRVEFKSNNRDEFVDQLISLVGDKTITVDEAVKLAKIKFDQETVTKNVDLLDRIRAVEAEDESNGATK
jgi:transposase